MSEYKKVGKGPKGIWAPVKPEFGTSKEFALLEVEALKQFLKMRTAVGKAVSLNDGIKIIRVACL